MVRRHRQQGTLHVRSAPSNGPILSAGGDAMSEDLKKTVTEKLLESLPTLLSVAGLGIVVLGVTGGVTYNSWLPIPDANGRVAATAIGSLVLVGGIALYVWTTSRKPAQIDASPYGIKITKPNKDDVVDFVDVEGSITKALPEGYSIRIFRLYPGTDRMTPTGSKAKIYLAEGRWEAYRCHAGGRSGEKRFIAAFLVGPSGSALIEYHDEAAQVHRKTMDQLRKASEGKEEGDFLPAIYKQTADMDECDRKLVTIK